MCMIINNYVLFVKAWFLLKLAVLLLVFSDFKQKILPGMAVLGVQFPRYGK